MIRFKGDALSDISEFYPYRKAKVTDIEFVIDVDDEMYFQIQHMFERHGYRIDNHIVFKFKDYPLYYWLSDNELRVGHSIQVYENGY